MAIHNINHNGISFTSLGNPNSIVISSNLQKEQFDICLSGLPYVSSCGEAVLLKLDEVIDFCAVKVFQDKFDIRPSDNTDKTVIKFQKSGQNFIVSSDTILPNETKKTKTHIEASIPISMVLDYSLRLASDLIEYKTFERSLIDWTKGEEEKKLSADLKKKIDKLSKMLAKHYTLTNEYRQTNFNEYNIINDGKVVGKVVVDNGTSSIFVKNKNLSFEKIHETYSEGVDRFIKSEEAYHLEIARDTVYRNIGILVE